MATSKEFNSKVHIKCMIPNPAISKTRDMELQACSCRVTHRNSINLNLDSFPDGFVKCAKGDVAPWGLEFHFCLSYIRLQCEHSRYLQYFCFYFSTDLQRQTFKTNYNLNGCRLSLTMSQFPYTYFPWIASYLALHETTNHWRWTFRVVHVTES